MRDPSLLDNLNRVVGLQFALNIVKHPYRIIGVRSANFFGPTVFIFHRYNIFINRSVIAYNITYKDIIHNPNGFFNIRCIIYKGAFHGFDWERIYVYLGHIANHVVIKSNPPNDTTYQKKHGRKGNNCFFLSVHKPLTPFNQ